MGVQYGAGPVIKCDAWDPTQIHRDLHGDGISKPHPCLMKLRMVDDWVYHIGNYIPEISQNSKDVR